MTFVATCICKDMFKGKLKAVVPTFPYRSLLRSGPHSAYPKNAHSEPPSRFNISWEMPIVGYDLRVGPCQSFKASIPSLPLSTLFHNATLIY
jgi:hypothetical protein